MYCLPAANCSGSLPQAARGRGHCRPAFSSPRPGAWNASAFRTGQIWQDRRESNPQPPVLETGALPIELLSFITPGSLPRLLLRPPRLLLLGASPDFHRFTRSATASRFRSGCSRGQAPDAPLLRLFMRRVLAAEAAELAHLEPLRRLLLVLGRAVVAPLAVLTGERDNVSHGWSPREPGGRRTGLPPRNCYSTISVMVPDPTVRPPSRMAKRAPASSATGTISSPLIVVLSPGITISTPSGRCSVPVTSVVRM